MAVTPIVYVVQEQDRVDPSSGRFVPKYDVSAASEYGELRFLLGPRAAPFNSAPIVAELRARLRFFRPGDYLLLLGNPCFIGWATAIAVERTGGAIQLLQWSGKEQRYLAIKSNIREAA
jgi:hypothetical protein